MTIQTLDLRDLADEWAALLPLSEDTDADDVARAESFEDLCTELGIEPTPDDLRYVGENYEPTLILESTFEEYAQELAEDIGAIPSDAQWPLYCIDWERAARDLAMDYTSVTFDGDDYLIRAR